MTSAYQPNDSFIEPIQFEINGRQYMIGAWDDAMPGTEPWMRFVHFNEGDWLIFSGATRMLNKAAIDHDGGDLTVYMNRMLPAWSERLKEVHGDDVVDFYQMFGDWLTSNLKINGTELSL